MPRQDPQFNLRMPEELKQWVKRQAQQNCRSQTAEIVFSLWEAKKRNEHAVDQNGEAPSAGTLEASSVNIS